MLPTTVKYLHHRPWTLWVGWTRCGSSGHSWRETDGLWCAWRAGSRLSRTRPRRPAQSSSSLATGQAERTKECLLTRTNECCTTPQHKHKIGYWVSSTDTAQKAGNILFYLRLYGFGHMKECLLTRMNECCTTPQHKHKIGYWVSSTNTAQKAGNTLFNNALNTFYLRSYGFGHMKECLLTRMNECCTTVTIY